MSLDELLQGFSEKTVTIDELKRELHALQRRAQADETALDRETRDIAIALIKAVGIDLKPDNLLIVLGALFEVAERLRSEKHHDRLRKIGKGLEERFATILRQVKAGRDHADAVAIDDSLLVDPQGNEPVDLFIILQRNPTESHGDDGTGSDQPVRDQIDAVASRHGLKRYTHISSRNPVCVLVGEVKPIEVTVLADRYDGVMVRNKSGGTFRGPDPSAAASASTSSAPATKASKRSGAGEQDQASDDPPAQLAQEGASQSAAKAKAPDPQPEADTPDTDQSVKGDGASPARPAAAPRTLTRNGPVRVEEYRKLSKPIRDERPQPNSPSPSNSDADLTTGRDDQTNDGSAT